MDGRRRYDLKPDEWHLLAPGEYMRGADGWVGCTPNDMCANLAGHEVVEHADGTITVSPSIRVTGGGEWHGFLEHGVWREC